MQIYHDGGNSGIGYINYAGSNKLMLSGNQIAFFNKTRSEVMLQAIENNAVVLYYDNVQKFQTTSSGVSITGNAEVSGDLTVLGTLVYEDVTNVDAVYISTARSGLRITDGGLNVVGVSTFQTGVDVVSGGIDVYTGGTYKINSADVLSATTLGAGVTNSSLTTVGAGVISNRAELTAGQPSGSDYILLYDADVGDLKKATISNAALQGVQGTQGTQGIQGITGTQGIQGIQGVQGTQGTQGSGGTQGTQGITGAQGTYGTQGTQGTQGIQGIQGITGTQGIQGSTSYDAGTLDGLDSSQFLRSDAADVKSVGDLQFGDNIKLKFGASNDLSLYHDASNSYIVDQGTGDLRIRADNAVVLQQADGTETYAEFNKAGAVNLYYDNANKLQTTSTGINVTGSVNCDGALYVEGSGYGQIEVGGASGAYIDLKRPYSDDFDLRLITTGTGGDIHVNGNNLNLYGHFIPGSNNAYDIGSSSVRWRNVYTNDLNLSNEGSTNDVDGTWGNYTIQEGEDDLFLINRRSGKKYKFMLQEVE